MQNLILNFSNGKPQIGSRVSDSLEFPSQQNLLLRLGGSARLLDVLPTPRYKLSESALPLLLPLEELDERDDPLLDRELDDE